MIMKLRNQLLKYNLQYFADGGGDGDGADNDTGDGNDDQDDDDQDDNDADDKSKKSGKKGKFYSQEEIDEIITKRLERERKKQERRQRSKEDKKDDEDPDKSADKSSEKLSALEEKVLCYDHDIAKEYVKEAIALAKAYVDEDTDMDEALDLVTKKFPQFVKGYKTDKGQDDDDDEEDTDSKKSWGQRQKGTGKKIDPVEARFLERNPGLKID
jgi:hypothetical protein